MYRMAKKSINWLVKCTLNTSEISLLLTEFTKNFSKLDPPCSMHNSQRCDTILQIDWEV
jgi:hypothetical protein